MSNTLHAVAPPPKTKEARQACTEKLALALAHFVTVASLRASSYPLAACFFYPAIVITPLGGICWQGRKWKIGKPKVKTDHVATLRRMGMLPSPLKKTSRPRSRRGSASASPLKTSVNYILIHCKWYCTTELKVIQSSQSDSMNST